jgi:hypothetical protein
MLWSMTFCHFSFQNQLKNAVSIFSQIVNPESIVCINLNVSDFLIVGELRCGQIPTVFVCAVT